MIIIECEDEVITDKDFMIWFSMNKEELEDLKRDNIKKGFFIMNKFRFDLKDLGMKHLTNEEATKEIDVTRKVRSDKSVFIKDVVMYKETAFFRRDYFIDGNEKPKKDIADIVGVCVNTLSNILQNVKKININDHIIETKKKERFSDIKYFKDKSYNYKNYFLDGKKTTVKNISKVASVNINYLNKLLTNVKSMKIDGYLVEMEKIAFLYTAIKDGKEYKDLPLCDCEKLTSLNGVTIKGLRKSGLYSRKDGWRFI